MWSSIVKGIIKEEEAKIQNEIENIKLLPRWKEIANARIANALDEGHNIVDTIRGYLSRFDESRETARSADQCKLHELYLSSACRNIYEGEFEANELKIKKRNRWIDVRQELFVLALRRCGKTYSVAMFICAFILGKPHARVPIFSPSLNQSVMMKKLAVHMIETYFQDVKFKVIKRNEQFYHIDFGNGDIREINAYPNSVDVSLKMFFILYHFFYCFVVVFVFDFFIVS
jgi:hypothetical protein